MKRFLTLAVILLVGARFHIPEVFTGLIGAVLIGLSIWSSSKHNRRHGAEEAVLPDGGRLSG